MFICRGSSLERIQQQIVIATLPTCGQTWQLKLSFSNSRHMLDLCILTSCVRDNSISKLFFFGDDNDMSEDDVEDEGLEELL